MMTIMKKEIFSTAFICILLITSAAFAGTSEDKKENAKQKLDEAKSAVGDYAYSEKEAFVAKTKNEIARLKSELTELETKASKKTGQTKLEAQNKIEEAKLSVKKLNVELESLKESSESRWVEVKKQFSHSMETAKDKVAKSRKWLSEKIAP